MIIKKKSVISLTFILLINTNIMAQDIHVKELKFQQFQPKIIKREDEWKKELTPLQYEVTRKKGTERPFTGEYYDFYEKGKYFCIGCGAFLFDSSSKFKSGCGWPSFSDVADQNSINIIKDTSFGIIRTEITCSNCGAHLGHVFDDGPPPMGLRYCINSAALKFVSSTDKIEK